MSCMIFLRAQFVTLLTVVGYFLADGSITIEFLNA